MVFIELRRIFTKGSVLFMLLLIIPVFIGSSLLVGLDKPVASPRADSGNLAKMHDVIYYNTNYVNELEQRFTQFADLMTPFLSYGAVTSQYIPELRAIFGDLNTAFKIFYQLALEYLYDSDVYINLKDTDRGKLKKGIDAIAKYIEFDDSFDSSSLTLVRLESKMEGLSIAWMEKGGNKVLNLLASAKNVEINETQRGELKLAYDSIETRLNTITEEQKRIEFSIVGYEYLNAKYRYYAGIKDAGAADRIRILSYMVENESTWLEYSRSYNLNGNAGVFTGTTVFDFIFKNFILVLIFLILFSILVNAVCIFDDIKNNTIITPLLESKSRMRVILAKLIASALAVIFVFTVFLTIFSITAVSAGAAVAPPIVLTTFMGSVIRISSFVLLLLYLFAFCSIIMMAGAIAALLSLGTKGFQSIFVRSCIITLILLGLGCALFAVLGLLNISSSIDVLVALPAVLLISAVILTATVQRFIKRDF